jgi:hypothetical protein
MHATAVWQASIASLVVFLFLASGSLVRQASAQQDGVGRAISMNIARPIDRVSNFFSLNRPLDLANQALGREEQEPAVLFPPTTLPPPSLGSTTTTLPPRVVSPEAPLLLQVFGDSQAINVGTVMQKHAADDPLVEVEYDAQVATGLARPDYYNWPARVQESLDEREADVVVLNYGANDDQSLMDPAGDVVAHFGSPEWDDEYRRRIAGMMDLLKKEQRRIVWLGGPQVRKATLNETLAKSNAWAREEANIRPWVDYVDSWDRLSGPEGEYVDYFIPEGQPAIKCRRSDGVHLTLDCLDIVVGDVLAAIRPMFPIAPPTTTLPPTTVSPATTPPTTAPSTTGPGG